MLFRSLMAEAYAIRDGVRLACDLGYREVALESDSLQVVKMLESSHHNRSEISAILHEITVLSGHLENFKLIYVPREANELAHLCAKQATSSRRRCLWINYIPAFLIDCIRRDCNPES